MIQYYQEEGEANPGKFNSKEIMIEYFREFRERGQMKIRKREKEVSSNVLFAIISGFHEAIGDTVLKCCASTK
jgi:hypothetical protein